MKTKFFLCMRPLVNETDDGSPYSTVSSKTSGRRNRHLQLRKKVAVEKDPQKSPENTTPVSKTNISIPSEESVSLKKLSVIKNGKVNGGVELNSGVYLMVSSLFFTMFLGRFLGILCTLILVYSVFPHRKDGKNNGERSMMNLVSSSPEKGSPEDYKKRVIMEGLLERKSHNRESIKFLG